MRVEGLGCNMLMLCYGFVVSVLYFFAVVNMSCFVFFLFVPRVHNIHDKAACKTGMLVAFMEKLHKLVGLEGLLRYFSKQPGTTCL